MAKPVNEMTPMQRQYHAIKERNQDCILFFRLGDFYEMFDEDAKLAARELDLTLTTRDRNKPKEEQTPMCGVPYHSVDSYIARLVQKGYKVAICEQMEDPTPKEEKSRRFDRLCDVQNGISVEIHNNYIGKTMRCLVDGKDKDQLTARTEGGRLVRFSGCDSLIGTYQYIEITGATTWSLTGELQTR